MRTTCKTCRTPFEPTESQLALLNLSPHDLGDKVFYYGRGCSTCNDTGYKSRTRSISQRGYDWRNGR